MIEAMTELKLPLFPVDGTAVSVTMTVWLGVCVVVFFNLRFGWTLSGLVVPGYLVPLLLVKPVAVAIIFGQAILTYLIVRILSDGWGRLPWWSSFFGRDRFFAIVLVSILVRAATDGWLLPAVGQWCNEALGLQMDYRNDLHSYGLIVVSLLANYFWKPRLRSGLITSIVTIGLTYVLVKYVLLNVTNFNLGSLHYLYEDVSTSLLSSPKAYVFVITTAYVASWLNLRYSWDFNGILVPALLALLWYDPAKIAVSLIEALWILVVAIWVLRWPVWRRVTIEGGRKLLLFFTIATAHRLALAHVLPRLGDFNVTDAYGFGYLLTTLMAIKSHEKKIALRLCRATLQTSMMGAVLASVLGFGLSNLPCHLMYRHSVTDLPREDPGVKSDDSRLWQVINAQRVRQYRMKLAGSFQTPMPREIEYFQSGVAALLRHLEYGQDSLLHRASDMLARANYEIRSVEDRFLVLTEREPARGWGTYVLNREASNSLLVEVPAPLEEWATLESGLVLFQELRGRALAIAGAARLSSGDRASDVLLHRNTIMSVFHNLVDRADVVQVRGYTKEWVAATEQLNLTEAQQSLESLPSQIWVRRALPPSLNLADLKRYIPLVDVRWRISPTQNVLREPTSRGIGELILNRQDRRRMRNRLASVSRLTVPRVVQIDGYLSRWLRDDRLTIARQGSNKYHPAIVEELLFLDEEVLRPLLLMAGKTATFADLDENDQQQLQSIGAAAETFDYQLILFRDKANLRDYFVLAESVPKQRHWGTFVFRAGLSSPYLIEVPRPLYERQTHQFGVALLDRLDAAGLFIAGAHPFANADGTADVARLANKVNLYQLVRQVLLRDMATTPLLVVQTRAIQAPIDADLVLATDDGTASPGLLSDVIKRLTAQLHEDGLTTRLVDGSPQTAGYELGLLLQASSLSHSINKQMVTLWLSPSLRHNYRDSVFLRLMEAKFAAVGISTVEQELCDYLSSMGTTVLNSQVSDELVETVQRFRENGDIMHLYHLVQRWPSHKYIRLIDAATDQSFLLMQAAAGGLPVVFNIDGAQSEQRVTLSGFDVEAVRQFARARQAMLQWEATP